eukprot:GEMP01051819.1.p3 GENE.GEMP01051819.1~~GEMP01051819.1.p3  ORF type:complete len:118 (+),score=17.25 GEMP01051819.1:419-772(+)
MCCAEGGLRMLVPYTVLSCVSGIMNMLNFIALPLAYPVTWFVLLTAIGEILGAYYGYAIFKQISPIDTAGSGLMGGPLPYRPPPMVPRHVQPGQPGVAQAPQQQAFALFGGEGRRLG